MQKISILLRGLVVVWGVTLSPISWYVSRSTHRTMNQPSDQFEYGFLHLKGGHLLGTSGLYLVLGLSCKMSNVTTPAWNCAHLVKGSASCKVGVGQRCAHHAQTVPAGRWLPWRNLFLRLRRDGGGGATHLSWGKYVPFLDPQPLPAMTHHPM